MRSVPPGSSFFSVQLSAFGSYTNESHTVPPPPSFHHSPFQVFAARSIDTTSLAVAVMVATV